MRFLNTAMVQQDLTQYDILESFHTFAEANALTYWDIRNLMDLYGELLKNTPVNRTLELPVFEGEPEPPKPSIEVLV